MTTLKSPSIRQVLSEEDKALESSQNELTYLLRLMAYELGIGPKQFDTLINRYLNDPKNGIVDSTNPNARMNHKGNMIKEFGAPKITWPVFMKWLRVLGAEKVQFIVNIERNGVKTQHQMFIKNEITKEEEDLSRAVVLDEFPGMPEVVNAPVEQPAPIQTATPTRIPMKKR